jgi:hypothetical protein
MKNNRLSSINLTIFFLIIINNCNASGIIHDTYNIYKGVQPSDEMSAVLERYVMKANTEESTHCYALCSINCSCGFVAFQYPDCLMFDISSFDHFENSSDTKVNLFYKNSVPLKTINGSCSSNIHCDSYKGLFCFNNTCKCDSYKR